MLSTLLPRRVHPRKRPCWRRAVTSALGQDPPLVAGWGARIRTWEWRNQNPLPYHLPTRQSARHRKPVPISCQAERATPLEGPLITLVSPDQAELAIVLRGDLAAILRFAAGKEKPRHPFGGRVLDALLSQKSVVAGARNARFLRLVERTIPRLGVAYKSVQIASCRLDNGAWSPGGDYLPKRDRHCMFKPEIHTGGA